MARRKKHIDARKKQADLAVRYAQQEKEKKEREKREKEEKEKKQLSGMW